MKNVKPLHARQLHAIKLLAAGTPDYLVAQRIEVSTMTIYRWKRQENFNSELRRIAYSGLEDFSKKLNEAALTAMDTLNEVMNDLREPSTHRSKVALGIINAMPKVHEALSRSAAIPIETQQAGDGPHAAGMVIEHSELVAVGLETEVTI